MLIVRGRNLPPYDVERSIEGVAGVGPSQLLCSRPQTRAAVGNRSSQS